MWCVCIIMLRNNVHVGGGGCDHDQYCIKCWFACCTHHSRPSCCHICRGWREPDKLDLCIERVCVCGTKRTNPFQRRVSSDKIKLPILPTFFPNLNIRCMYIDIVEQLMGWQFICFRSIYWFSSHHSSNIHKDIFNNQQILICYFLFFL